MLEFMRKNAGSKVVWLIIGAISLVFIFFGVGGQGGGGRLISVNGEEIGLNDFQEMTRILSERNRSNPAAVSDQELRKTVVAELVNRTLMQQFGRAVGLEPTDRAVAQYIYGIEAFQTEGKFDKEMYDFYLERSRISAAEFENDARRDLVITRANALVGGLSQVYQPEAMEVYHFRADKLQFDFLFFPAARHLANLSATDAALEKFYAANQEGWRLPATLKVEYVEIKPADFLDQVEVTEEELKNAYQESADRFTRPETAQVSHILFRFPQLSPTEEEKAGALERARQAAEGLSPETFADKAKEVSDDPMSAARGGELGSINADTPLFNITESVLALPVNTVSDPLESMVGYHLVMLTGHEEARPQTLEEARGALAAELKSFKAREKAVALLEDLIVRTETNPNLAEAAKSLNLMAQVSEPFSADNPAAFFEGNTEAVQRAFQAEIGRVGSPVEELGTLALYTPLEKVESHIPPLAEVKESVTEAWRLDEADQMARREALAFIQKTSADTWAAEAEAVNEVKSGQSDLLPRFELMGVQPLMFTDRLILLAAISSVAAPGQISPVPVPGTFEGAQGCFALKLKTFEAAGESGFDGLAGANIMVAESMKRANDMSLLWLTELHNAAGSNVFVPAEYLQ